MDMDTVARRTLLGALMTVLAGSIATGAFAPASAEPTTTQDLFGWATPYALGHRGCGANRGEDPTRPLENSLEGFHRAFRDGIRIVELDLQFTADGKVVVFHDDVLGGGTCVNTLTYDELLAREPQVPLFRALLASSRHFSRQGASSGLILAEIKVPIPFCDDARTSEQAESRESTLVAAVIADIRQADMEEQVVINAGSPSILRHAYQQAPEIPRALSLNFLQMIPPAVAQQFLQVPVTQISRSDCGLPWYEVGNIARLPSYYCTSSPQCSFQSFVATTLGCARATAVSVDKTVFLQAGPAAPALVASLHAAGLEVIAWTVDSPNEWVTIAAAGVDGITTNDIALGLERQAALGDFSANANPREAAGREPDRSGDRPATEPSPGSLQATGSTNGAIHVRWRLREGERAHLELLDVSGRRLDSRDVQANGGRADLTLGEDLSSGIYFVRLSGRNGAEQAKAVIVR
jgi:glycerophosphoryl diester phosphodiesterase